MAQAKWQKLSIAALALAAALAGCAKGMPAGASAAAGDLAADAAKRSAQASRLQQWRDEIIYFVLTDRFHNGDRRNDINVRPNDPHAYHGGDLQGVIDKLDYIKGLGATSIWVTPIQDNRDEDLVGKYWGFHGYWIKDFTKVDEHLGDEALFKKLVAEAHRRGMKVVLDFVVNHVGYDAPMAKDPSKQDWFHRKGDIKNYDDQYQLENHDLAGLPDFNTQNPEVIKFHEETWAGWANRTGIDGFRMDTVKHVDMPFWTRFNRTMTAKTKPGFLKLGEVLHGDVGYCGRYTREGGFDSLFDFPMYYTISDVFARGQSMRKLGDRLRQDGAYADANLLSPFLDNHDVPRFMSTAGGDESKLRLAMAFLMTMRGVPSVYYGTEIGMEGPGEPENREDMRFGSKPALTNHFKSLAMLRQELTPLRRGAMLEMWQDDQVYGFSRLMPDGEEVQVFLNNGGQQANRHVPLRAESKLPDGTVLVDRLTGEKVTVSGRHVDVKLKGKQARIFTVASAARSRR